MLVVALSDDVMRNGRTRCFGVVNLMSACSLQDDVLSLPCDGVSDTKLCVSSNPSSFSSWLDDDTFVADALSLIISRGGLHTRSGVSVGDFRFRIASRTSS